MKSKFRIGISPCPNDTFIFRKLIREKSPIKDLEFEFEFADVQTLNEKALQGELDLLKISFGQLPNVLKNYGLLPCGGALGRGCGPLLIQNSDVSFSQDVWLPGVNTTARHLFDFWAKNQSQNPQRKFGFFDEIYRNLVEQKIYRGVVIHESRFTYEREGLDLIQDLGAYWEHKTQSPIPLGGIILNRRHQARTGEIIRVLQKSLEDSLADPNRDFAWIQSMAQIEDPQVVRDHIALYVNEFSLEMREEGFKAVDFLMNHLLGETPKRESWLLSENE